MPPPRQMRWDEQNESGIQSHERIATIVARLRGGGDDASAAAQELYALTSFTAAVTIDNPAAYTAYDKLVFGGASVPDHHEAVEETEWVDGKSYKMGDGFMTYTDEGAKADTRRVAVMHSKNATSNRIGIGMVSGVFDALTSAIASGTPDTRYHSLRALSQISFRNSDNKRRFGETEGGFQAVGLALDHAGASGDAKLLAEACRALSLVVSGDSKNQEIVAANSAIVRSLYKILNEGEEGEAKGQAGKVLNTICHLLPLPGEGDK